MDILATTSLEKRLRAIEKTIHSMPGNCHYQQVSQTCDGSVVSHNQQHHTHHGDDDVDEMAGGVSQNVDIQRDHVGDDEEEDLTHDGVVEEEDDQQQASLQPRIQNVSHDQQLSAHIPLEQQQQMLQQQCDDVTNVDECCQRTTPATLGHGQLEVAEETLDTTTDHHLRHAHHRHRRSGHAQSLLL